MTISYMTGLTAGSLVGYVFENMLGPPIAFPCLKYPFIPKEPDEIETTTWIAQATAAPTTLVPTLISVLTSTLAPLTTENPVEPSTMISFINATTSASGLFNGTLLENQTQN